VYRVRTEQGVYEEFGTEVAAKRFLKNNFGKVLYIELPDGTTLPGRVVMALPPDTYSAFPLTPRHNDMGYFLVTDAAIHRLVLLQDGTLGADLGTAIFDEVVSTSRREKGR